MSEKRWAVNVTNGGTWTTHYCETREQAERVRQMAEDTLPGEGLRAGTARATITRLTPDTTEGSDG